MLSYETRISTLLVEMTALKVELQSSVTRVEALENLLKANQIPLPEERNFMIEHAAEIEKEIEEKEEKKLMSQAVHLKWTTPGVEGVKSLINEINSMNLESLEVLDLTGK